MLAVCLPRIELTMCQPECGLDHTQLRMRQPPVVRTGSIETNEDGYMIGRQITNKRIEQISKYTKDD